MGLEDVTAEIVEEAEQEAEQIVSDAEQQRDELLADAEQEKDAVLEEAREDVEREIEQLRQKRLSAARMEQRKTIQSARQDVLDDVFDRFRDRIHDMDPADERELLEAALDRLDTDIDIGTVHTGDRNRELAEDFGTFAPADIRGAIVESADGSRRFDLTFDTLVEETIEANRQDAYQVLFE